MTAPLDKRSVAKSLRSHSQKGARKMAVKIFKMFVALSRFLQFPNFFILHFSIKKLSHTFVEPTYTAEHTKCYRFN